MRLLCLFESCNHGVAVETRDRFEQVELEMRTDNGGRCQHVVRSLVHAAHAALDHSTHTGRHADLIVIEIAAPSALRVEQPALFLEMPEQFFDEKRVAPGFVEDPARNRCRRLFSPQDGEQGSNSSLR